MEKKDVVHEDNILQIDMLRLKNDSKKKWKNRKLRSFCQLEEYKRGGSNIKVSCGGFAAAESVLVMSELTRFYTTYWTTYE